MLLSPFIEVDEIFAWVSDARCCVKEADIWELILFQDIILFNFSNTSIG